MFDVLDLNDNDRDRFRLLLKRVGGSDLLDLQVMEDKPQQVLVRLDADLVHRPVEASAPARGEL